MLNAIESYVKQFTEVIAAVVGIDVEVVNADMVRVAGTGAYADGVGRSIDSAGELYRSALAGREPLFVENPRSDPRCDGCPDRDHCQEKLTLCAPVAAGCIVLGVIGLVCFTDQDRARVLANRDTYMYFIRQIADAIARVAMSEKSASENRRRLDMLLKITDQNSRAVVVFDQDGGVSFLNDAARRELGVDGDGGDLDVAVQPTGDSYSDMEEFELRVGVRGEGGALPASRRLALGKLTRLGEDDPLFARVLVFISKASHAEMISRLAGSSDSPDLLGTIVGDSQAMAEAKARVRRLAPTNSTVLITGESGVGKELFARAIHAASPRRDKPFVAINCAALPEALLESELFGYVRGAFTGANPAGRMGKFELADGGVLFLDEIGSMPLYLQAKLLRVLQEREFTRLGSNKPVAVDIRIVAATNADLPSLIEQKMFREDLYYRLNVIPLRVPPLREHPDDIPALAEYFFERYCRLFGKPAARVSREVLDRLYAYDWPGNVREFENCIEYMANLYEGGEATVALLPEKLAMPRPAGGALSSTAPGLETLSAVAVTDEIMPLAEMEQRAIRTALAKYGDTVEGKRNAAKALGIGIATLYRKLKDG